ncbi:M23 family metallopeptidase [Actinomadura rupiterrae]|uniref:M23 family metallopeptidase n=1 Tax=Actinomadura rupiterrae TaxID=559627 RepID=UPI0020A3D2E7|nr:M23 family metallopeptidase [Actinomadura rupiterrae]
MTPLRSESAPARWGFAVPPPIGDAVRLRAGGGAFRADEAAGWRWPLGPPVPAIVRGFSPPTSPWLPGHRGVDLAASPGDPVYAAGSGRVSYAGALAGRDVVAITHGELRTTYLPVRPAVPVGHDVAAGARIGTVESMQPPHCPQACLHWGLLRGSTYLDPITLVRPIVRLLPLWQPDSSTALSGAPPLPQPPPPPSEARPPQGSLSPSTSGPPNGSKRLKSSTEPLRSRDGRPTRDVQSPLPHSGPTDDRPIRPALRSASTAAVGTLTCLVLALSVAFVRRALARPRSRQAHRQRHRPPPNVIDLAHERRLRRPTAPQ